MNAKYRVSFYEYESGWGSRLDSVELFDSYGDALKRSVDFNATNNSKVVPDWYMTASTPELVDLDRILR